MIKELKILLLLTAFLCGFFLQAQTHGENKASQKDYDIYYNALGDYPFFESKMKKLDTSIVAFSFNDLIFNFDNFYNPISNIGVAHQNMWFAPDTKVGFKYSYDSFSQYRLTTSNTHCYTSARPYTSLTYTSAPGNDRIEETFAVEHNQKLGKTISAGANFMFINSKGFYVNEQALVGNFSANLRFRTHNDRYGFVFAYYHSRLNNQENGGISDDSQFTSNTVSNRKTIDVNLTNAKNFAKTGGWYFNHDYYLFASDSSGRKPARIFHTINYMRDRSSYHDKSLNAQYYPLPSDTLTFITDSLVVHSLWNRLAFTTFEEDSTYKFLSYEAGADFDFFRILDGKANKVDTTFVKSSAFNINPYAKLMFDFKFVKLLSEAHVSVAKDNFADYSLFVKAFTNINELNLSAQFTTSAVEQPWMYNNLHSTVFQWNNDLKKTFTNGLSLNVDYKQYEFGACYNIINNYSYLNQEIKPTTYDGAIQNISLYAGFGVDFWKFSLSGKVLYQYVDNKDVIHVPDFTGKLRLVFHQPIIKGKLLSNIGVDCVYTTPYKADAYMPILRAFYLQNEVVTNGFPYLNLYIKLQVKRARFYVQMVNITEGFLGYNYIGVPHYPLNDRQLKFGINWYFHD